MSDPEPDPEEVARLRAALASLADRPGWPPADAGRIFSALHGDLPPDERRAVVDELVRNPDAAAAWRLARELAPEEQLVPPAVRPRARPAAWLALAASVLVAVVLVWRLADRPLPPEPAYRSGEGSRIESLLPAGAPLSRAEPVLRWSAVEGATYRLRVLTSALEVLEDIDGLARPEHRLSDRALSALPPGAEVLWQVEARVPGQPLLVSPTFVVRLQGGTR